MRLTYTIIPVKYGLTRNFFEIYELPLSYDRVVAALRGRANHRALGLDTRRRPDLVTHGCRVEIIVEVAVVELLVVDVER